MQNKIIVGNSQIREDHKLEILNFIRISGSVSRTDIYRKTNISKPTVTRVIEGLLKEGLVIETGIGESSAGRKPVYIELNPKAHYCIGVNISKNNIRASVIDFKMNIINKKSVSIKQIVDTGEFKRSVADIIDVVCRESGIDLDKILGVGIGIPGIIDNQNGVIVDFASTHYLSNIYLKEYLEDKLGYKVFIDNNAKTRALGEHWYGYGIGHKNIIYVVCSEGIGSGIIADGNLLRGKSNVTGEFGHMIVNMGGRKCRCGRYGCVESYCSLEAVEGIVKDALRHGRDSMIKGMVKGDIESIDYRTICECAEKDDILCQSCLEEAAHVLSTGLANTIGIMNPEVIVLSGELFDDSKFFYDAVKRFTKENLFNAETQDVIFMKRKVKDNLYEIGAAALVYKSFFQD